MPVTRWSYSMLLVYQITSVGTLLFSCFSFVFGITVGSFLNVIIDRVPREESFLVGRSHCDYCKHTLAWYDLIPLFSFLALLGRCRYCKKFIGYKYPIVELTTGICFVTLLHPMVTGMTMGDISVTTLLWTLFNLYIFSTFIVIFYTDLWSGIIPDIVLISAIGITFIAILLQHPHQILSYVLSALGAMGFFLALFLGTRGKGMGFGDVKLAFFLGLLLGWPGIFLTIYAAFLTGAVVALILVLWRRKRFFGGTIPFGPFLVLGALVAWFWTPLLWQKILGMF